MKSNLLKNSLVALTLGAAVSLVSSCQMDQQQEIEGPTQVAKAQTVGPGNIAARISDVGKDGKEIFDITEVQPEPPGGMAGWTQYLSTNLKYPQEARNMGIEGTVIVVFTINSDGSISNPEILRGIGAGADEEALRVVSESPNWTPAMQKDTKVNSRMRLPIRFKLS